MPKRKHLKAPLIPETPKPKVIPADLEQKVNALKALVSVIKLLNEVGHFPHTERIRLEQSIAFVGGLHKQMFDEAQKHPQAFMVDGLLPDSEKEKAAKRHKNLKPMPITELEIEGQNAQA